MPTHTFKHIEMRKLSFTLLVLFCVLQLVNAQTPYYWNGAVGATGTTGNLAGGSGNWNTTSNNWLTSPTLGGFKPWPNTTAYTANFGATGATGAAVTVTSSTITSAATNFTASGYTLKCGTNGNTLVSPIYLSSGVNLTVQPTSGNTFPIGAAGATGTGITGVTGATGTSLTLVGSGGSASALQLASANVIAVPTTISITGTADFAIITASGATASITGSLGVTGVTGSNVSLLGKAAGGNLTVSGAITSTNPINLIVATGVGGGNGYLTLAPPSSSSNTFSGTVSMAATAGGGGIYAGSNGICGIPAGVALAYTTATFGGYFDLNGCNVTVTSLNSTVAANLGAITNSGTSGTNTLTLNQTTTTSFNQIIQDGTSAKTALALSNNGTITLSAANTFTGGLSVNGGGTVTAGVASAFPAGAAITLNSATLNTGAGTGFTQGSSVSPLGILTIGSSNGTLALGSANSIYFANSNETWSGTLSVTGWTGSNHIYFGTDNTGLSSTQLNTQVTFSGGSYNGQHGKILPNGEVVPTGAVIASLAAMSPTIGYEGSATVFTVTVNATVVPANGTTASFTISGIQSSQINGGSLTGQVIFNGSSSSATSTFTIQNDNAFEGTLTGSVILTSATGGMAVNTTPATFTLYDAATYYWSGGNVQSGAGLTPYGGNGTLDVANSWVGIATGSTGNGTNWADGYPAIMDHLVGTLSINGTNTPGINPTSLTVKTNNDVITPNSATAVSLSGNVVVGSGAAVNLGLNDPAATALRTLVLTGSSITGFSGSTLTISGAQTSSTSVYSWVELQPASGTSPFSTSVPVIMNATGGGYVDLSYNAGITGTYTLSGGVQIANNNTGSIVLGATNGYTLAVNGITCGNNTNVSPVIISNKPAGSGSGSFTFEGTSNYHGPTTLASAGTVQCATGSVVSPNSVYTFGPSGQGPIFDLNGTNQTMAGLASVSGATGKITNSQTTGNSQLTINLATGITNSYSLPITNGAGSTVSLVLNGADNTTALTLGSVANTFTGGLTLNANGKLITGVAGALISGLPVTLNGGTLATGSATGPGYTNSVAALTVSGTGGTIAFAGGTTGHTLTFSSASGISATSPLNITGWSGTSGNSGGAFNTSGKLVINGSLSSTELANINFAGFGTGALQITGNEIVPAQVLLTATLAAITPNTGSETAGTQYTITVNTTLNGVATAVANTSTVAYTISGVLPGQFTTGSNAISNTITIQAGNSTGTAIITAQNDNAFEGTETGTVSIASPTNDIGIASSATQTFQLVDDANFYWNGATGVSTSIGPALGGSGTWNANYAWIAPSNDASGVATSWQAGGYNAYLPGPVQNNAVAGVVTLASNPNPTNTYVQATGYTLTTGTSPNNTESLGGNIDLPVGYNLNIFTPTTTTTKSLGISTLTNNGSGATLTVNQGAATSVKVNQLDFNQANGTIAANINIVSAVTQAGGGAGSVVGIVGTADGINVSGTITNASSAYAYTLLGITGNSNNMTISGAINSTAPINFANGTTGGAGNLLLTNTGNSFTTAYFNGSSNGSVKAGPLGSIPSTAMFVMGATSGSGQNFDLNGNDVIIASLSSVNGGTGVITNTAASGTNTLALNQSGNTSFGLIIQDGATAKTAFTKSGVGTLTISGINTFTGNLTLAGGVLQMGGTGSLLANNMPVVFNGGTFSTGATSGYNEAVGALSLTSTGTIALGTGNHTLTFNGVGAFTGSILNVTGWAGTGGGSGTAGKIVVIGGTLTQGDLAKFRFSGTNGAYPPGAVMVGNEVVPPAGYAWTGLGGNTAWTTANNWNPTITGGPTGCSASVYIPVVSTYPVLTSAVSIGDFAIADNAQITLNAALSSCGNITGGTSSAGKVLGTSALTLNGTGAQSISGYVNANSVEINKTTGAVTSTGSLSVNTGLIMSKGNFTNSGGSVTLVSNSLGDAYLDNFTSGTAGTYNGNLTVQRYISNPSDGYRDLSSPVATTVADLANSFSVFGSNGVDCWYSYVPYPNVQVYNEALNNVGTANGLYNAGWVSYTGNGNALSPLKGVAARTYQGSPFTVSFTGNPYTGNQSVSVSNTPSGTIADDGWNFVGNPYPSPIKWSLVKAMNTSITGGSYHIFKTSGEYTGGWASHNGVTGVNGAIDEIAPGQGFFVFAPSGTNTFKMDNTVRTVTPGSFRSLQSLDNEVRLVLGNGTNSDEVVTYTDAQATTGYDIDQDALKIPAGSTVNMAYSEQGYNYAINVIDNLNDQTVLPLIILVQDSGNYALSATTLNVQGLSTYLKDAVNNSLLSLDSGSVQLVLNAGQTYTGRYSIVFKPITSTTGINNLEPGVTSIYSFANKIFVQRANSNEATIMVSNILGQDIAVFKSQSEKSDFELPATTPWYAIVKVVEGKNVTVSKVLISGK